MPSIFDDDFSDDYAIKGPVRTMGDHDFFEKSGQGYYTPSQRCYTKHPVLSMHGGTVIGGNCDRHDHAERADIYIALDERHSHPLFSDDLHAPRSLYYPITNMKAPNRPEKFKALIGEFLVPALQKGLTVHIGCIGGHGRTGLVIAALAACEGREDPIKWVRDNYCRKAVESSEQIQFLVDHFACLAHKPRYGK